MPRRWLYCLQSHFFCITKGCNPKTFIMDKGGGVGGSNILEHKCVYKTMVH